MEEDYNIFLLFKQFKQAYLHKSIEALKANMETNPSGTVSYTTSENHLRPAVSELPEYLFSNRSVSAVSTGGGDQ